MRRGMQIGRPLYNINTDILKVDFVAPQSTNMPDGQFKGFWKHQESKKPPLVFNRQPNLDRIGVSDDPDKPAVMTGPMVEPGIVMPEPMAMDLDRLFGKAPEPINQLPMVPPKPTKGKDAEGGPRKRFR